MAKYEIDNDRVQHLKDEIIGIVARECDPSDILNLVAACLDVSWGALFVALQRDAKEANKVFQDILAQAKKVHENASRD